jgi:UDP-N-acetylmuramoyl-L-alanyl-D-glutamate--2,6-diaminopimelate ligase
VHRWTYGESRADFQFQVLGMGFDGTRFRLNSPRGTVDVEIPLPGRHNVYNAVAAMAVGMAAGASLGRCAEAASQFSGVPGRMQRVPTERDIHVFVDYAHSDDALVSVLNALQSIRAQTKSKCRIITVFGCGGDRDRGKRPQMAKAALAGSDVVYITSDNPRHEPPMQIIAEIVAAVPKELMNSKVFVEVDRREGIAMAIRSASPGDVVLIAGKGHENYQIVGDRRFHMSDMETAKEILNGH